MKRIVKLLCCLLCFAMLLSTFVACSEETEENSDPSNVKQSNEIAERDMRLAIWGNYTDYVGADAVPMQSYYNQQGGLVKEVLYDSTMLMPFAYVSHTYDESGRLSRSAFYEIKDEDDDMLEFRLLYEEEWYATYTYDKDGRAEKGAIYKDNKLTDQTIRLEYYDNGAVKKRSFYDDTYLISYQVYDEKGRCVTDCGAVYQSQIDISYRGDTREIATMSLAVDNHTGTAVWSYENGVAKSVKVDMGKSTDTMTFTLDGRGLPMSVEHCYEEIGQANRVLSYRYTYQGDLLSQIEGMSDGEKLTLILQYNAQKQLVYVESQEYDGALLACAEVYEYLYDAAGRLSQRTETEYILENGTKVIEDRWVDFYTYDAQGNLKTEIGDHYDSDGFVTYRTEEENTYDGEGRLIAYTGKNASGATYEGVLQYDGRGNCIRETETYYDKDGIMTEKDVTENQYDAANNLIRRYAIYYDTTGRREYIRIYDTKGTLQDYTSSAYDQNGKLLSSNTILYDQYGNQLEAPR